MPSMTNSRIDFGADVLNGQIYVAGGFDGDRELKSGERFDPIVKRWMPISDMNEPREKHGLISSGGFLFAIGGNELKTVEKYDPCTETWITVEPMIDAYEFLGAASLDCPDFMSVISS